MVEVWKGTDQLEEKRRYRKEVSITEKAAPGANNRKWDSGFFVFFLFLRTDTLLK